MQWYALIYRIRDLVCAAGVFKTGGYGCDWSNGEWSSRPYRIPKYRVLVNQVYPMGTSIRLESHRLKLGGEYVSQVRFLTLSTEQSVTGMIPSYNPYGVVDKGVPNDIPAFGLEPLALKVPPAPQLLELRESRIRPCVPRVRCHGIYPLYIPLPRKIRSIILLPNYTFQREGRLSLQTTIEPLKHHSTTTTRGPVLMWIRLNLPCTGFALVRSTYRGNLNRATLTKAATKGGGVNGRLGHLNGGRSEAPHLRRGATSNLTINRTGWVVNPEPVQSLGLLSHGYKMSYPIRAITNTPVPGCLKTYSLGGWVASGPLAQGGVGGIAKEHKCNQFSQSEPYSPYPHLTPLLISKPYRVPKIPPYSPVYPGSPYTHLVLMVLNRSRVSSIDPKDPRVYHPTPISLEDLRYPKDHIGSTIATLYPREDLILIEDPPIHPRYPISLRYPIHYLTIYTSIPLTPIGSIVYKVSTQMDPNSTIYPPESTIAYSLRTQRIKWIQLPIEPKPIEDPGYQKGSIRHIAHDLTHGPYGVPVILMDTSHS
ncbi:hypothetical protein G9A89_000325 [Geosiphon pyriformis]|nr:hypothetical protein G9A89_000325 [Geosiphon pyriformis]